MTDLEPIRVNIQKKKSFAKTELPRAIRDTGLKKLESKLSTYFETSALNILEESIHNETLKSLTREGLTEINMNDLRVQRTYDQILRRVCLHLNPDSPVKNNHLLEMVKNKHVKLAEIVSMSPIFMHPIAWAKQYEDQKLEAQQVAEGVKKAIGNTLIKCNECIKNGVDPTNVTYTESQDNSADEPMTIHAECLTCSRRWKQ